MTRAALTRPAVKRIKGEGHGTVVLVHGTMDHCGSFRRVAEHLHGWERVSYDRRGWGTSRAPGSHPSFDEHVSDLASVLDVVDEPVIIAGHSLGGLLALSVAAMSPEQVRAVVAYEPPVRWLPWWPTEAPWERIVREAPNAAAAAGDLLNEVAGMPVAGRRPVEELTADGEALIAEMGDAQLSVPTFDPLDLDVPVVVAAGRRSLQHHIEVSRRLAELLPRGRYVEVAGASHPAHVTHPDQFGELIRSAAAS